MTAYSIIVPGKIRGKQRPRVTKWGAYTPPETRGAENAIGWAAREARASMLTGPVTLSIVAHIQPPASWTKAMKAAALGGARFPTSKPDLDNVVKLVADALNGIAWLDDAQIVCVEACKRYSETEMLHISWSAYAP